MFSHDISDCDSRVLLVEWDNVDIYLCGGLFADATLCTWKLDFLLGQYIRASPTFHMRLDRTLSASLWGLKVVFSLVVIESVFRVEVIPAQRRNLPNAEFSKISTSYSNIHYSTNIAIMKLALVESDSAFKPNVLATAKKFNSPNWRCAGGGRIYNSPKKRHL